MIFSLNGETKAEKEAKRNREYEVSLVQALKNSYRDIEEIRISSPSYSDKPGNWSCTVQLAFSDGQVVKYGLGHALYLRINKGGVVNGKESDILDAHDGKTVGDIRVIYSDGEEVIE